MYILHIETSTPICSVAISDDDQLVGSLDRNDGRNHSAILTPMIGELMESVSLKMKDLGAISVSSGPGSYTGLRVGGSTAKAIAYSLNIPLLSVPSLAALAGAGFKKHPGAEFALPMMDARRNEVYLALYNREMEEVFPVSSVILEKGALDFIPEMGQSEGEYSSKGISSKSFSGIVCCGDGAFKLKTLQLTRPGMILDEEIQASAKHLISPTFHLLMTHQYNDPLHYVPYYLKPPNITQPRSAQ